MKDARMRVFSTFQMVARVSTPFSRSRSMATTLVSARKTKTSTCGMMKLNGDSARPLAPVTCHFCSLPTKALTRACR